MAPGMRFTVERPVVDIRSQPSMEADAVSRLEQGDEIVADSVFLEEGIEWVKLSKGAKASRGSGKVFLNLRGDAFVPTHCPTEGLLLRKHQEVVIREKKEEGVLTKAEIQEVLEKCSDPGILLPLESKYWHKQQLEMFVMSGGTIRPKWCSVPDERLMANINMSKDEVMRALTTAADWISNADAILIGSGAGMGVDSGLGTFRGGQKGVWAGLEAVGLAYEEICMPKWFQEEPHLGWAFWNHCHNAYQATVPHDGYTQVREWGQRAPLGFFSFTSNIDSHWIKSGTSAECVLEVHGAVRWLQCSKPCAPDVWRAPKDLCLEEDEVTHRVQGVLPTCPKCKSVARPNVQMFGGDNGFSKARRQSQFSKYDAWLKKMEARPDKDMLRVTCLEVGCGLTVPTVRRELEEVVKKFPGARLVRVNPENPGIAPEIAERGVSLPMPAGAAIQEIGKQVVTDEDRVAFILWGEDSGVEIQAPHGTCIGRLLRIAQSEDGTEVTFSKDTMATSRPLAWGKADAIPLDKPAPHSAFSEVKIPGSSKMQVTAVLYLNAKFRTSCYDQYANSPLLKRCTEVMQMLDEMNELFQDESYQAEVRKCPDRRGVLKMAKSVHHQVLPKYGIEASEKGSAFMASYIGSVQADPKIQTKVDASMELSYVKYMNSLPAVESKKKKPEERKVEERRQPDSAPKPVEPEPATPALPQPLEVTVSSLPSDDAKPDTVQTALTNQTTIGELRKKLQELLGWDDEGAKATKFLAKLGGGSYGGLKDEDLVKREVFLHGGPGLRPPEEVEVSFTEMAPDDGVKAKTFPLAVMTDDSVTALRQKLGQALGWSSTEQKRAKFLLRLPGTGFCTLKEHEKVAQRRTIYVHGVDLSSPTAAPASPPKPAPAAAPPPAAPPPAAPPPVGNMTVALTILGTQDDEVPDCLRVSLKADARIAELRRLLAEQLQLGVAATTAIKFIAKNGQNFESMLNSDKIREQVFVRGVPSLQAKGTEGQGDAQKKASPQAAPQKQQAPAPQKPEARVKYKPALDMMEVSVLVDQNLNFRVPLKLKKGNTIANVKDILCASDTSGRTKPESFALRHCGSNGNGDSPPLADSYVINSSCNLEVVVARPPAQQQQAQQRLPQEPAPEPLKVSLTRLTTLEDPRPQRLELACSTVTKVSDLRTLVARACNLDGPASRRVKLLFKVPGGNGFMTAKEGETVTKEMFVHNIDKWPE